MTDTFRMLLLLGVVVVGWGIRRWFVMRRHVASVGEGLLKLRRLLKEETTYVPLAAGDAFHPLAQGEADAVTQELTAMGFTILGDRMEQRAGAPKVGPTRWFASSDGTVCGWFAVIAMKSGALRPVMTLFSESDGHGFFTTTRGGASPHLAQPPNLTRELIPWTAGLPAAVERHRGGTSRAQATLTRVGTLEEATALLQRLRGNTRSWRDRQAPELLLEPDLRAILGKHYDRMAAAVGQYVRDHG